MLPKPHRFSHRLDRSFFNSASTLSTPHLTLFVRPAENSGGVSKAVVIIPKKVVASAVGRHRLRRQLEEELRPRLKQTRAWLALRVRRTARRPQVYVQELGQLFNRSPLSGQTDK